MKASEQFRENLAEYFYSNRFSVSVVIPARIKAYASSKQRRNKTD
jgi:transposase